MLTLDIGSEFEAKLQALVEQEHTTPELLIQKLISQYTADTATDDFFACAGLWKDSGITQESLREQAWRK
ncbi:MAG: hypothetical protein PHU14_13370 [Methylovulum sp.]|nr:hypothetical protein [Methylovulum sp.]